ncbi:flagellar assembly protein FliH [Pseudoalteromonas tunicata]|uniref:flagellar assembly protein FliH n=1 Tax=Pseudoalteromonas tunicata TaxID=314281 RepID=UPI00273F4D2E|nr:flagellar assembly protein FliH [Pseudoalteromonas tunicata]MDP5212440.1 flagellar assembly protein FliH [Pseudoalteromonas tunicata]
MSTRFLKGHAIQSEEAVRELLKNWPVPEVQDERHNLKGRSTAFGTPMELQYQNKPKVVTQPEPEIEQEVAPLTLQEIEQIRQDAFDEGMTQGHAEGYAIGLNEGKSDGLKLGFDEGSEQGKEQGLELAKPLVDEKLQALQALIDSLHKPLRDYDETVEQQLVHLAVALAEAIVFTEVKTNPQAILATLKQCIDALPHNTPEIELQLNPEDLELVEQSYGAEEIAKRGWYLKTEPSIAKGGCIVKTPSSSIDYTVKYRISETLDSFLHNSGIDRQKHDE